MDDDVRALLEEHRFRRAFELLLQRYETKVFRMAIMFMKNVDRAEEVAQDIFLKLWQALPAYDGRAAPSTWLYTIARNTCLSAVRSEAHRNASPLDSIAEPVAGGIEAATAVLNRIDLAQCLERLPEIQRQVIALFYLQEKSIDEVARMLDWQKVR